MKCIKGSAAANDIHMALTRCWRCYALMAEEHKGLFEACHFDPGSSGLLRLCHTKTFISHMLGTSETSQSAFTSAQRGDSMHVTRLPDLYSLA